MKNYAHIREALESFERPNGKDFGVRLNNVRPATFEDGGQTGFYQGFVQDTSGVVLVGIDTEGHDEDNIWLLRNLLSCESINIEGTLERPGCEEHVEIPYLFRASRIFNKNGYSFGVLPDRQCREEQLE